MVVRNATVWTQGADGRMENADLLVRGREGGRGGAGPGCSPGRGRDRRHGQARDAGAHRPAHPFGRQLRERERIRDRPRGADGRRGHPQQHLDVPPARRRTDERTHQARLRQPDRGRERDRQDALGRAARGPEARGLAAHGEVRARRKPEAASGPVSRHAHGDAGDHPRPLHGRARLRARMAALGGGRGGDSAAPRPAHGGNPRHSGGRSS